MSMLVVIAHWSIPGLLGAFMLRRLVLIVASVLPARQTPRDTTGSIAVIVAGRNEARRLPTLLGALQQIDYPAHLVHVVLVSDGSTDETEDVMRRWSTSPFATDVVALPTSAGKGGALRAGYARTRETDLVVVLDADCEPATDILQVLSGAFADTRVGAASAYPRPANAGVSVVSRYAALERWAHHLIILAGEDRLGLNPSIVGVAFAVRRLALDAAGGFPMGRLSEDTELALSITEAGWRVRWLGVAVVREDVAEDLATFYSQRNRWGRGILQSAHGVRSIGQVFVVAGYLDRVVLLVAILLVPFGIVGIWLPVAYMMAPALSVIVALKKAKARPLTSFFSAAVVMFGADLFVSVRSTIGQVMGSQVRWGDRA